MLKYKNDTPTKKKRITKNFYLKKKSKTKKKHEKKSKKVKL